MIGIDSVSDVVPITSRKKKNS